MSRLSRAAIVLVVAVVGLGAASIALGAFSKGIYRSKPPANRTTFIDFSFTATKTKAKQVRYTYRRSGGCSNGQSLVGDEEDYAIPAASINQQTGKFNISVTEPDGDLLRVGGKVAGRKANGTFRVKFTVGGVTCDTRTMRWKAFRLG